MLDKYSVLMSVYSGEKAEYLRTSIESMLGQTVKPDQFVIVKDGQLGEELERVINHYSSQDERLFTVVELPENEGLGVALDEGISHCRNELVARMDSDDISLPDRCEKELALFEKNPELSIVSGNIGEFDEDPDTIFSIRTVPEKHEDIVKRMRIRSAFNHPAVMFKKSDVIRCGGYGLLRRKQDHVLFSKMINNGCQSYNIQDVILLFRENSDGISRKKSWENCSGYIKAQTQNFKRGECNIFELLFIYVSQIVVFIFPHWLTNLVKRKFYRT